MSAFSAMATALTSIPEEEEEASKLPSLLILLSISCTYAIFGFFVSVFMYGRKTSHNPNDLNRRTTIYGKSNEPK